MTDDDATPTADDFAAQSIGSAWNFYHLLCFGGSLSGMQLTETRRAFYSGALSFYRVLLNLVDTAAGDEAAEDAAMTRLVEEIGTFHKMQILADAKEDGTARC